MLTLLAGIVTVGVSVAIAVAGQLLLHRRIPLDVRKEQNDVAGFIYAVVGLAYGALLAFMFIIVWQQFDGTKTTVEHEANDIASIYDVSSQFSAPEGPQIQNLTIQYAQVVVSQEWPLMDKGEASPQAWSTLNQLGTTILGMQPQTEHERALYGQLLDRLHDLTDNRRVRLLDARDALGWGFWALMIPLAVITITFTYLFGLQNTAAHAVMIAALTVTIVSILFLINALDLPFRGDIRVGPDAFQLVLQQMGQR